MKRFFAALNLLLCLELIMAPVAPQIKFFGSSNVLAEDCPAGFQRDPGTGRCQMSEEAAKLQQSAKNCDPSDSACFKANAENLFQQKLNSGEAKQNEKPKNEFVSTVMNAAAVGIPLFLATTAISDMKTPCKAFSFWTMVAGSASMFVGELYTSFNHKKKLKSIKKDWNYILSRKTNTSGMDGDQKKSHITAAQAEAFEMLARAEDAMEETASLKSKFYAVATAAYAASATTAVIEILANKTNPVALAASICAPDPKPPTNAAAAQAVVDPNADGTSAEASADGATADGATADGAAADPAATTDATANSAAPTDATANSAAPTDATANSAAPTDATANSAAPTDATANSATPAAPAANAPAAPAANAPAAPVANAPAAPVANAPAAPTGTMNIDLNNFDISTYKVPDGAIVIESMGTPLNVNVAIPPASAISGAGATATSTATSTATGAATNSLGIGLGVGTGAINVLPAAVGPSEDDFRNLPANTPVVPAVRKMRKSIFDLKPEPWDSEILNKKNEYLISQASDIASFYVLTQKNKNPYSSPSIDEYQKYEGAYEEIEEETPELLPFFKDFYLTGIRNLNPIPSAIADEKTEGIVKNLAISIGTMMLIKKLWGTKLATSEGRAITSGVLGGWSMIMWEHTKSQASASKNRANVLREIKAQFQNANDGMNPCKSEDRNDQSKPYCYCYTADNKRNSSRYNSQICQTLWTGMVAGSTNYLGTTAGQFSGCIDNSRKHDPACKCKTSPAGCMKVIPSNISVNPGTFSMASSGLSGVNDIANGNFANVNGANQINSAARLFKKANDLSKSKGLEKFFKTKNKEAAAFEKKIVAASGTGQLPLGGGNNSRMPMTPAEAIKDLEKEIKKNEPEIGNVGGGNETVATPENKPEENLEFGLTEGQAAAQDAQVAEVMKQNLDFGQNDIQGSNTNLFEVLTNRYQRSGMRRLFDDEGKTQADKPAKSDITK